MAFLRPFICYSVFLDHLDLQVVEFKMFNEIILIKTGLIMLFEIPHCGIQPDRISQIHLITDFLKSRPAAYCFSQLKQETYLIRLIFSISKDHCIRFPYSGISLCTFLYFLKYTGICFYSAFINSRMISRMISSSSGESILLKWLPVAAV